MKKAVLITGAGSGIGQATALQFSQNGYHVILNGRNLDKLKKTQNLLSGSSTLLDFDLEKISEIEKYFKEKLLPFKESLEVLINNAGIFERAIIEDSKPDRAQKMMAVNFLAPFELTRSLLPWMKENKKGSIVNISSTLGLKPSANTSTYSASKAAMINWTATLALEAAPFQIRANCVCPGIVETPIHDPKSISQMQGFQPLGRVGTAQEIAEMIYFLAGPSSSWTTGSVISVDGGINLL